MSGGYFGYDQHAITNIADTIQAVIDANDDSSVDEYGCQRGREYPPEVIERMQEGVRVLQQAYVYAHRIDWLLSGDDGEENFLKRLDSDLSRLA